MKNIQTLDQLKDKYYGKVGSPERDRLENELEALRIGFKIKSAREQLNLTQEQLADRIEKKRSYISKIENEFFVNGIFVEKAVWVTELVFLPFRHTHALTKSTHQSIY